MLYKKSSAVVLIISLLATSLLAGCRKKDPVKAAPDFSGIELTYYKVFDDTEIVEPAIRAYEAQHPGLKIHYRKFSDFDEYQRVILNEMAEGEGPDIFSMPNTWFTSNYRKLTPLPEKFGGVADFQSTFVDVAYRDLVRGDIYGDKRIYALPMTVDNLALYYNKAHFEDALPERGRPSTTWQGIKEDVALLNREDNTFDRFEVSGIAMGRADNISRAVDILYLLFLQHDLSFYDEKMTEAIFAAKQGGAAGSFPGLAALELFVSFADPTRKHYSWNEFTADDDTDGKEIEAFAEGKVSMIIGFSYTYEQIEDYIDLLDQQGRNTIRKSDIRATDIPQLYDPDLSAGERITYASYFAETVSRNTEYPDIAWDFLLHMTSKEVLADYFDATHRPTSRRDMIEEQKLDPKYGVFADQVGIAKSFPILEYYTYKDIFTDVINRANLSGTHTSDLVYAQDLINELMPPGGVLAVEKRPEVDEKTDD